MIFTQLHENLCKYSVVPCNLRLFMQLARVDNFLHIWCTLPYDCSYAQPLIHFLFFFLLNRREMDHRSLPYHRINDVQCTEQRCDAAWNVRVSIIKCRLHDLGNMIVHCPQSVHSAFMPSRNFWHVRAVTPCTWLSALCLGIHGLSGLIILIEINFCQIWHSQNVPRIEEILF